MSFNVQPIAASAPCDVLTSIFSLAHLCDDHAPSFATDLRLVCQQWNVAAVMTPALWHHIIRRPNQASIEYTRATLHRTGNSPLHLLVKIKENDIQLVYFLPVFEEYLPRWQHITIECEQADYALRLLDITRHSPLPSLLSLTICDPHQGSTSMLIGNPPLSYAPNLVKMQVRACYLTCLASSATLVDLTLMPCHVTPDVFAAISSSPIELLRFKSCTWALSGAILAPVRFECLEQVIIDDIHWDNIPELLQIIDAPNIDTLALILELDADTYDIDLVRALAVTSNMPNLSNLMIAIHSPEVFVAWYIPAVLYMIAWALPTVTHFSTNISIKHLLCMFSDDDQIIFTENAVDTGFSLDTPLPPLPIPAIGFPNLETLRSDDEHLTDHVDDLVRLARSRFEAGYAFESITLHVRWLSGDEIDRVLEWSPFIDEWLYEEIGEAERVLFGM